MHKMNICLLVHSNSTEKNRQFNTMKVKILLMLEPSWLLWQYTGAGKVLDSEIHTYSMIHWPAKQLGRGVQGIKFYPTTFQSNGTLGRRGMKIRQWQKHYLQLTDSTEFEPWVELGVLRLPGAKQRRDWRRAREFTKAKSMLDHDPNRAQDFFRVKDCVAVYCTKCPLDETIYWGPSLCIQKGHTH